MKKITLPWSKSITNRDLILAWIYNGKVNLNWILISDDTKHMINALKSMWIKIEENGNNLVIYGWKDKISWTDKEIYLGQSWTCMRFLPPFSIFIKEGFVKFVWEERLMERPLKPLIDAIKQLWIKIESNDGFPPITIYASEIKNNKVEMDWTISSQFFTGLMNIWAFIKWWLEISVIWDLVSKPYIDLTICELEKFGIKVDNLDYKKFIVYEKKDEKIDLSLQVEWDASALSYIANFIVFNSGEIEISNLWKNTKQWDYKYLDILNKVFNLEYSADKEKTIFKSNSWIKKVDYDKVFDFESMPDVSLSFMVLVPFIKWDTKIIGLKTLNLKESKRIDAMKNELEKFGIKIESTDDSITIWELNEDNLPKQVDIETYKDHRIAMSFATLKTYLEKKYDIKINILNPKCVEKTYPNFWEDLKFMEETS